MAQPQIYQSGMHQPVGNYMWAISKLHEGQRYMLQGANIIFDEKSKFKRDRQVAWTLSETHASVWRTQKEATKIVSEFFKNDKDVEVIPLAVGF